MQAEWARFRRGLDQILPPDTLRKVTPENLAPPDYIAAVVAAAGSHQPLSGTPEVVPPPAVGGRRLATPGSVGGSEVLSTPLPVATSSVRGASVAGSASRVSSGMRGAEPGESLVDDEAESGSESESGSGSEESESSSEESSEWRGQVCCCSSSWDGVFIVWFSRLKRLDPTTRAIATRSLG